MSASRVMLVIGASAALVTAGVIALTWSPVPAPRVSTSTDVELQPAQPGDHIASGSPLASAAPFPPSEASPPAPHPERPAPLATLPPSSMAAAPAPKPEPSTSETSPRNIAASAPLPPANAGVKKPKPPIADPIARDALALVGADTLAEFYWLTAINDPTLGPEERSDLIEDLNQDGFADPKNLGPQDLPLILNRLHLIEQHAPSAMDQVNADAFKEAYKDLLEMYGRLTQR